MAAHVKGTIKQITTESETLTWSTPKPWYGNEIKYTSLLEIDAELDTSRFHISIPIAGTEPYLVDGKNYSAKVGEYFVFNPTQTAQASGVFKSSVDGYCIFIDEKTMLDVANTNSLSVKELLDSPFEYSWQQQEFMVKSFRLNENYFGQYLSRLQERLLTHPNNQFIDWDAFYFELATKFLQTHRQIGLHLNAIPSTNTISKHEIYRRLSLAYSYILDNFANPFSLEDLSKVALFSKYYTLRLYRKIYGLTPYKHVLLLRIDRAKKLLQKNYSPTEVAHQLSFSDRRAFSKVFKKIVGMAPSVFQRTKSKI